MATTSTSSSAQREFSGIFARLLPKNSEAQALFSRAVRYMEETDDKYHLQFIDSLGNEGAGVSEPIETDTDYDTATSSVEKEQGFRHLVFSLRNNDSPKFLHLGWMAGRGASNLQDRNVDFLLAKPRDPKSRNVANVHICFRFNRISGMLMLVAASSKAPVYLNLAGTWHELEYQSEKLLYQTTTTIKLGPFEYDFEYTVEEYERESFFKCRNAFLRKMSIDLPLPPKSMWKLHLDKHKIIRHFLVFETVGSGTFGWVNKAMNIDTGEMVVLKELPVTSTRTRNAFLEEVAWGESFRNRKGLLPALSSFCEHGNSKPCGILPEKVFICLPFCVRNFTPPIWTTIEFKNKMRLLKDTLEGIESLHNMGIMHRDITVKNMLIVSTEKPEAVLCDFGKATSEPFSQDTRIGPIRTLAPEVWDNTRYTVKIDLWAWAYAVAEILGYSTDTDEKITVLRMAKIHEMLSRHGEDVPEDRPLINLLYKLLVWNPTNRLSVDKALAHECWIVLSDDKPGTVELSSKDRPNKIKRTRRGSTKSVSPPSSARVW